MIRVEDLYIASDFLWVFLGFLISLYLIVFATFFYHV